MNKELGEGQGVDQTKCATEIQSIEPRQEIVRVLRVIEYTGPRSRVEHQIGMSIHGEKVIHFREGKLTIKAATIGTYPEVLKGIETDPQN